MLIISCQTDFYFKTADNFLFKNESDGILIFEIVLFAECNKKKEMMFILYLGTSMMKTFKCISIMITFMIKKKLIRNFSNLRTSFIAKFHV